MNRRYLTEIEKGTVETIVYGLHAVGELIQQRSTEIDRVYFDAEQTKGKLFNLLKLARKKRIPYQCIPNAKLNQIAQTIKHQGIVASCPVKPYDTIETLEQHLKENLDSALIIVPASLEDPRNLGALIRTSVAFGVTALLLERKQTAPLSKAVAKTSVGMLEYMTIIKPKNLAKEITVLKEQGFQVIGALGGDNKKPQNISFTQPTILIVGGEHRGIPPYLRKLCDDFIAIPTNTLVPSLNVSVATSIILYECARQRKFSYPSLIKGEKE